MPAGRAQRGRDASRNGAQGTLRQPQLHNAHRRLSDREQEAILPFLFDHVRSPEYQCRFHWEEGSIAFWDNRSVQHYAVADYHERRIVHRATIAGPVAR